MSRTERVLHCCFSCTLLVLSFPPRKTTRDRWEASAAGFGFAGELQATLGANEQILVVKCFGLGSIPYVSIKPVTRYGDAPYISTLRSWLDPQTLQNLNTATNVFPTVSCVSSMFLSHTSSNDISLFNQNQSSFSPLFFSSSKG